MWNLKLKSDRQMWNVNKCEVQCEQMWNLELNVHKCERTEIWLLKSKELSTNALEFEIPSGFLLLGDLGFGDPTDAFETEKILAPPPERRLRFQSSGWPVSCIYNNL